MIPSLEELKLWAQGKVWYFYTPLVLWYIYVLIRFLFNVNHEILIMSLDLMFHEMGHMVWSFAGQFIGVLGGTFGQLFFPTAFLIYFFIRREYFSSTFPLAWLAINIFNIARYMADATCKCMDFYISSGGGISTTPEFHDWEYLFNTFHLLSFNIVIANIFRLIGFLLLIATIGWSTYLLWIMKTYTKQPKLSLKPSERPAPFGMSIHPLKEHNASHQVSQVQNKSN